MHPFHMLGVAGVFGGSLFSAMHKFTNNCAFLEQSNLKNWVNCRNFQKKEEKICSVVKLELYMLETFRD
jgi:photosystem II P680 reaction center D1 protein